MKWLRRHIFIVAIAFFFVLAGMGLFIKEFFFTDDSKAIYGSRLSGIKNVPITDAKLKEIQDALSEGTSYVHVRLAGKIIYVVMKVTEDVSLDAAKANGEKILEHLSDEEKSYYDIQIMIDSEKETNQFPIIGYKSHNRNAINWTRDRAES